MNNRQDTTDTKDVFLTNVESEQSEFYSQPTKTVSRISTRPENKYVAQKTPFVQSEQHIRETELEEQPKQIRTPYEPS